MSSTENLKLLCAAAAGATVAFLLSRSTNVKPSPSSSSKQPTLKYWSGRGLMEVARQCLSITDQEFIDDRLSSPDGHDLTANLGRLPVLETSHGSVGQSLAIYYYVAAENGLMGHNNLEAAQILSVHEHLRELSQAWRKVCPYGDIPSADTVAAFFEQGATDVTGTAKRGNGDRTLLWYIGRIELSLAGNGFAVGSALSLADVLLYNTFAEHLKDNEVPDDKKPMPKWRTDPFADKKRMDALLVNYPKIQSSIAHVSKNTGMTKWLATRGKQGF